MNSGSNRIIKKLLILAGSHFQIPVIKYAQKKGYYVITCDNRPENPGHALADKYVNVSTTDMQGVLQTAIENKVDGILAYASDPAAQTAGYVSEKLSLPGNPFNAIKTLGFKSEYRRFLKDNKCNHPGFIVIKDGEYRDDKLQELKFPLFVKPVDSSGSKGVTKVNSREEMPEAIKFALLYSTKKEIIIEEFIQKVGHQFGGEAYIYKGELVMMCLGDQQVNTNSAFKYVPIATTFPAQLEKEEKELLKTELQRIITLSGFRTGALNLEIMKTDERKFYFMEIGPRSGGNFLPEIMHYVCGFDEAGYSVEHALGNDIIPPRVFDTREGYYANFVINSPKKGIFHGVDKSAVLKNWIIEEHIFTNNGQEYAVFKHSGYLIGLWILYFSDKKEKDRFFGNPYDFYQFL